MVRICLLSIILLFTPKLEKKAYKIIAKEYEVDFVLLDPDPRDDLEGILYEVMTDKGPKGYAFIGRSKSKFEAFDYLVLLNDSLTIQKVKVLVYRENYGGEIGSTRWLRQFIGLDKPINRVSAISGATISVNSLHYSVNRLLRKLGE